MKKISPKPALLAVVAASFAAGARLAGAQVQFTLRAFPRRGLKGDLALSLDGVAWGDMHMLVDMSMSMSKSSKKSKSKKSKSKKKSKKPFSKKSKSKKKKSKSKKETFQSETSSLSLSLPSPPVFGKSSKTSKLLKDEAKVKEATPSQASPTILDESELDFQFLGFPQPDPGELESVELPPLNIEPQIIMDPDDPALETNVADTDLEDPIVRWEQNKLVSGSAGRKSWLCERLLLGHIIFAFLNNRRG